LRDGHEKKKLIFFQGGEKKEVYYSKYFDKILIY
jgi:hypothetical protein